MEVILPIFLIAAALIFAFGRMSRKRVDDVPEVERPKRQSRRDRKLEAFRAANPDPVLPTMFDLMMEEAQELGVNDIPGGEDLEVPIKLKVWRRDEAKRTNCAGGVRFEIQPGIDPTSATEDHVRLVCADGAGETGDTHPDDAAAAQDTAAAGDAPDDAGAETADAESSS